MGAEGAGGEDVDAVLLVPCAPIAMHRASVGPVHPVQEGGAEALKRLRRKGGERQRPVVRGGGLGASVHRCRLVPGRLQEFVVLGPHQPLERRDVVRPRARKPFLPTAHRLLGDTKGGRQLLLLGEPCSNAKSRQKFAEGRVRRGFMGCLHWIVSFHTHTN